MSLNEIAKWVILYKKTSELKPWKKIPYKIFHSILHWSEGQFLAWSVNCLVVHYFTRGSGVINSIYWLETCLKRSSKQNYRYNDIDIKYINKRLFTCNYEMVTSSRLPFTSSSCKIEIITITGVSLWIVQYSSIT